MYVNMILVENDFPFYVFRLLQFSRTIAVVQPMRTPNHETKASANIAS
jgi:hypothetical protein